MEEGATEEIAEFHGNKLQRSDEEINRKVSTLQGVGTESSLIGPKDDVIPFSFNTSIL